MWNKETSQTNIRFGYEEFNSFKKVYGDFESIRTKRYHKLSHTIKDLEVKLTFQQTENDNFTHRVNLMKNEPFVEILSYCVVRIPYILLWESLNKYFTQKLHPCFNKIPHTKYAVFEIGVKKVIRKICLLEFKPSL